MTPSLAPTTPVLKKSSWQTTLFGSLAIAFALAGPLTQIWAPNAAQKVQATTSTVAVVFSGAGLLKAKDDQSQ